MQSLPRELSPKLIGRYMANSDQVVASVMDYRSQRLQEHCTFSPPYRHVSFSVRKVSLSDSHSTLAPSAQPPQGSAHATAAHALY